MRREAVDVPGREILPPSCSHRRRGRWNPGTGLLIAALASMLAVLPAAVAAAPTAAGLQEAITDPGQQETGGDPQEALRLTLLDAVETALRHNLQVKIAAYAPDLQEEGIKTARAQFDPRFSFNLPQSFNRSSRQGTSQLSGADVIQSEAINVGFAFDDQLRWGTDWSLNWNGSRNSTNNAFSSINPQYDSNLSLQVTQPLLRGFGTRVNEANIVIARNDLATSEEQFREQVQTVIFQTYQAYWELVFAREDLEVQRLALELAEQQLERNRIQVEIGTLAPIETVQAESQVANSQLAVIRAQEAVENAEDNLRRLLNVEDAAAEGWGVRLVPVDEPEVTAEPIDLERAIATAHEMDPQLRRLQITRQSDRLNLDVARNELLPQVNLTGSVQISGTGGDQIIRSGFFGEVAEIQEGGAGDALQNMFSGDFRNWSVGITVQFPLDNLAAEAAHARASISERRTLDQIRDRRQQLRVDVTQAARAVESGVQQVQQARTARELAERQLEAEERKFAVGTTTNFQVLEFQRQLADAQSQELRAIINLNNALARLEQAKGTLLQSLGVSIGLATVDRGGATPIR